MVKSKTKYNRFLFFTAALLFSKIYFAQFYNMPVDYAFSLLTEKKLANKDSSIHAGLKPYIHFYSSKYEHVPDTHRIFKFISDDPALDIAFFKHTLDFSPKGTNARFILDPILNIQPGNDYYKGNKTQTFTNTRGLIGSAYIGNKVYVETMFSENQARLPFYVDSFARVFGVVPGQGRWKKFKESGFDFAYSSGFVSIQATKQINVQFGHGKHKIGNGYRSLLLSDNCLNYPYARVTQQWFKGRLQYTNIYALFMNLTPASAKFSPYAEPLLQKKPAAFQYLSINPTKFVNVGFFQGIIWDAGDLKNNYHVNYNYYNPFIFSTAATKGLNDSNNILIGGDIKLKITNKINIYGQVMIDDLTPDVDFQKGMGYQAGLCFYDLLRVKNLFLQVEYNDVYQNSYLSPVTTRKNQSYSHYNQTLGFTPGHGKELFIMADYKRKRLILNARYHLIEREKDNDYLSSTEIANFSIGYLLNPSYNLNINMGYTYRNENFPNFKVLSNQTNYVYLMLRTGLTNLYFDF
ncbi:MAG: hypothetical protein IPM51_15590 [Sphingobacteriaceae bacterium]|nr:hypothetical protein [Sphingobacteriaceae bacterium]